MWLPSQLPKIAEHLDERILDLRGLIENEDSPLSAIVQIAGCSASFVSPEGLVITNHHCAQGALAYLSSRDRNLQRNGYLATTRDEELWIGPASAAYLLDEREEISERIRTGLDSIINPRTRYLELEARKKKIVAECEAAKKNRRCSIVSYFGGSEYWLHTNREVRDLRLVYAPPEGIGFYGGDIDNWMWPRHTGDFALFRLYESKDGESSTHAESNRPLRPKHWLRIAEKALAPDDWVLSAGFPGWTNRNRPLRAVEEAISWSYPRRIERARQVLTLLRELADDEGKTGIVARQAIFSYENSLKKRTAMLEQLVSSHLVGDRRALEERMRSWAAAHPEIAGNAGLDDIDRVYDAYAPYRDRSAILGEIADADLLRVARSLVRLAHEKSKPDAERKPRYQERNWVRMRASFEALDNRYSREVDIAMLGLALQRNPRAKARWLHSAIDEARGGSASSNRTRTSSSDEDPFAIAESIYDKTSLQNKAKRLALFDNAAVEKLEALEDPLIRIALALYGLDKEIEEAGEIRAGEMISAMPAYMTALRRMRGVPIAPDANSTLRITIGRVRGYKPRAEAETYKPFTVLSEVVAKHTGSPPFNAPAALLEAAAEQEQPFVDQRLGEVPVNFLSEIDLTGGSSGSATLNSKGELVGLAFDTNIEAVSSDWQFQGGLARAMHVDIRYILWLLDRVAGAEHLLAELKPSRPIQ